MMPDAIWKFPLELADDQMFDMPEGAQVLYCAVDPKIDQLCLWVRVTPENKKELRRFVIVGTGHPIPDHVVQYYGSAIAGPFVWHVWSAKVNGVG